MTYTTTDKAWHSTGINCLVYGRAGVGKTMLTATAPKPLLISAEAGLMSLRHVSVPVKIVHTLTDIYDVFSDITAGRGPGADAQTVSLDSLSEVAEMILVDSKAKSKDPRQAYGRLGEEAVALVKAFRDLPNKNCVIVAKETTFSAAVTGVSKTGPRAPGNIVPDSLPYLFDEVMQMTISVDMHPETKQPYHYLQCHPTAQVEAKDRSGVLAPREWPDLTAIFNKIKTTAKGA
jgi:hypothetical protein